ncbi:hypothetical protein MYAM1_002410 [Malassezia yamatoensis]|uniref:CTLH domain-containing protein n=1 Tax=Malassezia yamatoensis TaxID=253288 RepID=A0AAJ5YUG2_9BASI|nr:hypothetical protein MYAM1_002410 [Malassezia yamatoensis]
MVSSSEWHARLAQIPVPKRDLDRIVLDYLLVQGRKEAAETFSNETGLSLEMESSDLDARVEIRKILLRGDVAEAMECVNELNPEILDTNPVLFFHLQQLRMIELMHQGQFDEALLFAAEHLAPLGEEHGSLLNEIEQTMSLFVFDMSSGSPAIPAYAQRLYSKDYRQRVADELNSAILASQSYHCSAKLLELVQMLRYSEQLLGQNGPGKTDFPHLSTADLLHTTRPKPENAESMSDTSPIL